MDFEEQKIPPKSINSWADTVAKVRYATEECTELLNNTKSEVELFETNFANGISDGTTEYALSVANLNNMILSIGQDEFRILIVGQFKQGKSTLINALLGAEILPAYSTPCTAVITEVVYSENKRATIYFKDDIKKVPDDLYDKVKDHIQNHLPNVPPLVIEKDELEDCLIIPDFTKDQRDSVIESPYAKCVLEWPIDLCKGKVILIDSPGLNEDASRTKTTLDYLPQVDMIIHVLSALQLAGLPDKDFITLAKQMGHTRILFAVNRFDQLNSERECERVKSYAYKVLSNDTDFKEKGIFFLSAQKALDGKKANNPEKYIESGFPLFESQISETIKNERIKIKFGQRTKWLVDAISNYRKSRIENTTKILQMNADEIKHRYDEISPKLDELAQRIENISKGANDGLNSIRHTLFYESKQFIDNFIAKDLQELDLASISAPGFFESIFDKEEVINRLKGELLANLANKFASSLQKWGEEKVYLIVKNGIDDINRKVAWEVRQMNEIMGKIDNLQSSLNNISDDISADNFSFDIILEEFGFAGFFGGVGAGLFFGLPALMGIAFPLGILGIMLAGIFKEAFSADRRKERILSQLIMALSEQLKKQQSELANKITANIGDPISSKIKALTDKMKQQLMDERIPYEMSLENLGKDKENLEVQKQELLKMGDHFRRLEQKAKILHAKIDPENKK